MRLFTRRHLLVAVLVVFLLLVIGNVLLLARGQGLKSRLGLISVGMPRDQVESILGPPVVILGRASGKGSALIWVDQLWQVDVLTGPDGRTESMSCVPSDSLLRRTVGRVIALPQ
jgi:hypothetical protein